MKCPICKTELAVTGQAYLETLVEHVEGCAPSLKDKYQCPNKECVAFTDDLKWNDYGEYYCGKNYLKKYPFIDSNDAPLGSHQRQANVEINKHNENFTLLNLYFIKFVIEFKYKSNMNGDVLSRTPKITCCTKGRHGYQSYTSGISMFLFCKRQFKHHLVDYHENGSDYSKRELTNDFFNQKWDRRWYKIFFVFYIKIRYKAFYNHLSAANK